MKYGGLLLAGLMACGPGLTSALTLDEALDETLERNPFIRERKTELEQAAGYRLQLHSTTWPQARVGAVLGVQGGKRSGEETVNPFAFARGGFTQPLFQAAIPPSRRRGDVALLMARQNFNVAVVNQMHRARLAFFSAQYHRSLAALRRSQREVLDANIKSQEALYEAGAADRMLLTGAKIIARELDPRVEGAHRAYEGARVELASVMGRSLGAGVALPDPSGEVVFRSFFPNVPQASARAVRNRPDLQLARLMVQSAREDQRIVEAQYYPALNAIVAGDYIPVSETRRGSEGSPQRADDIISSEVRFGVAATWRVIDNGKVGGAVLRQRETRLANELTVARLEAAVPNDLARLQAEFTAIAARHRAFTTSTRDAERNAEMVRKTLAEGLASVLDFRGAESGLLDARSGVLTAAYQQQVALAEWDRATGRYFEFVNDTTEKLD